MVNRSRQNNGYAWQSEGGRGNFNVPKVLIPFLKLIAYTLDKEGVTDASIIEIHEDEAEILIRIHKN